MRFRRLLLLLAVSAAPTMHAQSAAPALDPVALLSAADANANGAITRAEFVAARAGVFPQLDRNGDGALSKDEFRDALPKGRARTFASGQFKSFDANKDGQLTAAEYNAAPTPLFDRADGNKDGQLNPTEITAARRQAGAER